jgi:hypothetical protein
LVSNKSSDFQEHLDRMDEILFEESYVQLWLFYLSKSKYLAVAFVYLMWQRKELLYLVTGADRTFSP